MTHEYKVGDKVRLSPLMATLGWPQEGTIESVDPTRVIGLYVRLTDDSLVGLGPEHLMSVIERKSHILSASWLAADRMWLTAYACERHGFSSHRDIDTFVAMSMGCLDAQMPDEQPVTPKPTRRRRKSA